MASVHLLWLNDNAVSGISDDKPGVMQCQRPTLRLISTIVTSISKACCTICLVLLIFIFKKKKMMNRVKASDGSKWVEGLARSNPNYHVQKIPKSPQLKRIDVNKSYQAASSVKLHVFLGLRSKSQHSTYAIFEELVLVIHFLSLKLFKMPTRLLIYCTLFYI